MFKKIKRKKAKIFGLFFFEILGCIGLLLCYLLWDAFNKYGLYYISGYLLLVFIIDMLAIGVSLSESEKNLVDNDITIASIFGNEVSPIFEFGNIAIMVYDDEDEVIWLSQTTMLKKDEILGKKIYELIPDFDDLIEKESREDIFASISGKTFQINVITGLKVIYLKDVSTQVIQNAKVESERAFMGHVIIDNYQDVITSLSESDFSAFVSEVKNEITSWAKKNNLFIRSYSNDSFLILGEEKTFIEIKKAGFSILDKIRTIAEKDNNPLTISIGIGKGNTSSLLRTSELAYAALNTALSRGGDQVCINCLGKPLEYVGAKNEIKQTRSHVRGRVNATSLANLIKNAGNVLIMGHSNSDFDSVGSSLGVYAICKSLKVPTNVVLNEDSIDVQAKRALHLKFKDEELAKFAVSPSKSLSLVNDQTLIIVVDTHRPSKTLQPELLEKGKEVCFIDHHIRDSDEFINNPAFQYHEPQSSSASELVTELIYYQPKKVELDERIATFLLAGISLDTKSFKSGTSGKTFEMAMILKNYQASTDDVTDFFRDEYEEKKLRTSIINSAKTVTTGIFIARTNGIEDCTTKTVLAKTADELLATRETKAVFVVGFTSISPNQVSISARSNSNFNVQAIMESMHGGGEKTRAATDIQNTTIDQVIEELENKIKVYIRDGKV